MPRPMPANIAAFGLFVAVNQRLHAVVVQAVWLDQVDDVELIGLVLPCV